MEEKLTLLLASASPRRRELLGEMKLRFRVMPADVNEWEEAAADPRELVLKNCVLKAEAVALKHPECPVLAADTTVALDGMILSKPADMAQARTMLMELSGKTHVVHTGVCLKFGQREISQSICETSRVTFRTLNDECIESYYKLVNPLDKAGAYGIQVGSELIIESWQGSHSNIKGLPIDATARLLEMFALLEPLRL